MARVSRQALNAIRQSVRAGFVRFIDVGGGQWHAVNPQSHQAGTYLIRCSGQRWLARRTAMDMVSSDVCPACVGAESESGCPSPK